jgi:outer membrane lipoprotein SlyB
MSDQQLGGIILGAAVGALLGLWIFGVWGAIVGLIAGAVALPLILGRLP